MDTSVINPKFVTDTVGIKIGQLNAPIKLIEFINLRCPFCKKWFTESKETLDIALKKGKIQRVIKLLDKDKESLQRGNVMHHHIPTQVPDLAYATIEKIFATQDEWAEQSLADVANYAENKLGLHFCEDQVLSTSIRKEAEQATIQFVPTLIIGDKIFDESISLEQLVQLIEQ